MHGRTDLPCHAGIVQARTFVQHFSSTIARLSLLLTHPTCGAGECAYGRFSIAVPHVCANAIWRAFHLESGVPDRLTVRGATQTRWACCVLRTCIPPFS